MSSENGVGDIKDLLVMLPWCEGYGLMNNINEVFELVEEKVTSMMNSMVYLLGKSTKSDGRMVQSDIDVLRKVLMNCRLLIELSETQKAKISVLQHKEDKYSVGKKQICREADLLRQLFPRKRKLPVTPADVVKKNRCLLDGNIAGVNRSLYRDLLMFPSPIFPLWELIVSVEKKMDNFHEVQLKVVLPLLKEQGLINYVEMPELENWVIVKEIRPSKIKPGILKKLDLKKEDYVAETLTPTLQKLKRRIDGLPVVAVRILEEYALQMLANIFIATVVMDENPVVNNYYFPDNMQKAVRQAKNALFREGFMTARADNPGVYDKTPLSSRTKFLEKRYLERLPSLPLLSVFFGVIPRMLPNGFGFMNPGLMAAHVAQAQAQAQQQLLMQRGLVMPGGGPIPQLPMLPITTHPVAAHAAAAAAAAGAQTRPSPMLVPPGMGIDDSASPADSEWTEHKHTDGRIYYHNRITKQSSWVKPDALKTPQERSASVQQQQGQWKEFMTPEGRPYYYNTVTKKTQWVKPEGEDVTKAEPKATTSSAPAVSAVDTVALAAAVQKKKEETDLEKAMKATLASMPNVPLPAEKKEEEAPMNDEAELKKRQSERFRELLRDKYNEQKISTSCNWDQAVKWIQNDPRFRILNKVSEKKQLFNAWKVQRQKEERDEKRLAIKKAKEDLEKYLQEHPKMKESLKYIKACEIFGKEPLWIAVNDEDRKEIFRDCIGFVSRRDKEKKEENRKRNLTAFSHILQSMDQITYKTTWAQAQRLLIENPQFAEEKSLQMMDKEDALTVFEDHIKQAEKEHEEEKELEEKRMRRQQRKVREEYMKLLAELHKRGELTSMSLWSSLFPILSTDHRFEVMLLQPGSSPLDLFKFYVEDLKNQYVEDRRLIKEILIEKQCQVTVSTEFSEFSHWVLSHASGEKVDHGNMKLCYNSMIEKAESKAKDEEKEASRRKRRLEGEFRNLLKAHNVDGESEWSVVKAKIEKDKAYLAMENDEERQTAFEHYKNGTSGVTVAAEQQQQQQQALIAEKSKKKKKEKKKKNRRSDRDSESDGEIREKERKKKKKHSRDNDRSDDEEKGKKSKKSRKRSRSRTDSPRHSTEKRKRHESDSD